MCIYFVNNSWPIPLLLEHPQCGLFTLDQVYSMDTFIGLKISESVDEKQGLHVPL